MLSLIVDTRVAQDQHVVIEVDESGYGEGANLRRRHRS